MNWMGEYVYRSGFTAWKHRIVMNYKKPVNTNEATIQVEFYVACKDTILTLGVPEAIHIRIKGKLN